MGREAGPAQPPCPPPSVCSYPGAWGEEPPGQAARRAGSAFNGAGIDPEQTKCKVGRSGLQSNTAGGVEAPPEAWGGH